MGNVTYAEAKHLRLERFLKTQGYEAAISPVGGDHDGEGQGTLRRYVEKEHHFLFFKWLEKVMYDIATLDQNNPRIGATSKNWVLHVYGKQYHEEMIALAALLSEKFSVDIHVRLESDSACKTYSDD